MIEAQMKLLEEVLFEANYGSMECSLKPKHPKIKRVVFGIINAMGKMNTFSETEIVNEAATKTWEAMSNFRLEKDADWDRVASGDDRHNLNRLIKAIEAKLEHELPQIINPNTKRLYDPETGGNVYVTIDFESLDTPIYDENDAQVGTVGDSVTESLFAQQADYHANPFLHWFREHRHDFLTARQNEFIESMSVDSAKDTDYVEECDFEELNGMSRTNLTNMKKRIYERTMKAWKKDGISRRETYLLGEIAKYREFLAIGESDDDLAEQNARLAGWIAADEDAIELGYEALAGDVKATKTFVKYLKGEETELEARVLYDIYEEIGQHVDRMKAEIDAYVPSAEILPNPEVKERNAVRKRKYQEFAGIQPCHVYNREGEYLRTIEPKKSATYKIMNLDAFGIRREIEKEGF
jgi:hypothetical protein